MIVKLKKRIDALELLVERLGVAINELTETVGALERKASTRDTIRVKRPERTTQ